MSGTGLDPATILAFVTTSVIIEVTPGPNMVWLAIVAAGEGRRRAYAAVAGVALGLAIIGVAAAIGLAAALSASPPAYQALRWGGVAYLLWLAWDGWKGDGVEQGAATSGTGRWRLFRRGLMTNLLNPKAAVFYVAVLPGFTDPSGSVLRETLTLSLIYVAVATLIHMSIATAAGTARRWLEDSVRERRVRRALSGALACVALWFAWKTRS